MAGFSVNLNGLKDIQDALKSIDGKLRQDVGDEINASAIKILTDAKRLAPVNFGQLRNQIALVQEGQLTFGVESKASYSPYVEFGTGPQVSVPTDFTSYSAQFKGKKGGKFKDFVDALTLWVKRKGIGDGKNDKGLAYVIARSILLKGMRPQPFLIPSYETEKPKLIQRLKKLLDVKS